MTGADAESRSQVGWVIVGGITFGTLFTLFVVPTAYTLLARTRHPAAAAGAPSAPTPMEQAAEQAVPLGSQWSARSVRRSGPRARPAY